MLHSAEDPLPNFLESVFKRLRKGVSFFVLEDTDDAETNDSKLVSDFRKKINLISVALKFIHFDDLKLFFDVMLLSRRNIFTLISSHCFKMCDDIDNIFFAFMYTCSYVNFVLNFCEEKGLEEFSKLNCMCTQEIFEYRLKEDFEAQGGWVGLENFALAKNLPVFVDFFGACFTDYTKLFTTLTIGGGNYGYGLHNNSTCVSSKGLFRILERIILTAYQREFEVNIRYMVEVLNSFKKVRRLLEEQSTRNQALTSESSTSDPWRGQILSISHIRTNPKSSKLTKKRRRRR